MLRNKRRWRKGEMARTIVLYVYAGGAFGVELISLAFKRIFAKKQDVEEEN